MDLEDMDEITFEKGKTVRIDGIPFFLKENTTLLGNVKNIKLLDVTSREKILSTEIKKEENKRGFFKRLLGKFR